MTREPGQSGDRCQTEREDMAQSDAFVELDQIGYSIETPELINRIWSDSYGSEKEQKFI